MSAPRTAHARLLDRRSRTTLERHRAEDYRGAHSANRAHYQRMTTCSNGSPLLYAASLRSRYYSLLSRTSRT
jgi:hypothetical protein